MDSDSIDNAIDDFSDEVVPLNNQEGNATATTETTTAASNKRQKTLTSKWWEFFDYVPATEEDNRRWAKCKKCGSKLEYKSGNGTNGMKAHWKFCSKVGQHTSGQCHLVGPSIQLSTQVRPPFDNAVFRELLVVCVIKHDLPFQFTEWEGVRAIFRYLRGVDFTIVSRNTCRSDVEKMYKREKGKVVELLRQTPGKISFTSDCWSSITTDGYITLTAHFIDRDWNMHKRILNFSYLPPPHNGISLSQKLLSCLTAWGLDKRVMAITLDNAASNDSCIDLLILNLKNRGVVFSDDKFVHIRCCAHIINLYVQDGLKEAVVDPAIKKVRECVRYVKGSQARKKRFLDCVADCSIDGKSSLKQDVPTRWNSTFLMLESAIHYRRALDTYALVDTNLKSCCPSDIEWEIIEKVTKFLGVFYDLTVTFSGSKYPTANLYFPGVYSAYMTLKEANDSDEEYMRTMAAPMFTKFAKYWGKFSEILAFGVILDPRYKYDFVEWCFKEVYGDEVGIYKAKELMKKLVLLFKEYENAANATRSTSASSSQAPSADTSSSRSQIVAQSEFISRQTNSRIMAFVSTRSDAMPQKSELDQYLEDTLIDARSPLDILEYWKSSQFRFPAIAAMARDILAIPISTVASESAFSIGGKVLNKYRSLLSPDIVEALICTRDWLYGAEEIKELDDLGINVLEEAQADTESSCA